MYISLAVFMVAIVAFFVAALCVCALSKDCNFDKTYSYPIPLIIFNLLICGLLIVTTVIFVRLINQRFGTDFKKAKFTLVLFLSLFSFSFAFRGSVDFWFLVGDFKFTPVGYAVFTFFFYFFCEWVPLFTIYMHHAVDFRKNSKKLK